MGIIKEKPYERIIKHRDYMRNLYLKASDDQKREHIKLHISILDQMISKMTI